MSTAATSPATAITAGPHRDRSSAPQNPRDRRDERHRDQVPDERGQTGRASTAGEPGDDHADQDEQQDLEDAERDEQAKAHSPVEGGHQQRVRGKRETGDDDRRGNGAVHGRYVTTFRSSWRQAARTRAGYSK